MPRYRIDIEYDGTAFVGWQIQPTGASVQGELAKAIERFSGESVAVRGAGRTDAGVHALGQVAHFDLRRAWDPFRVREALNFFVRNWPLAVLDCSVVPASFDARFSATARHYLYRILCRRAPPALERNRVWWLPIELDGEAMHKAAQLLTGRHDFTTFRAAACQAKSPLRTLDALTVTREGSQLLIRASARSFLHHQVRSMVGSLKLIGEGKWTAGDLERALHVRDRAACGPVAPAAGLYLVKVDYGPEPPIEEEDVDQ
ncbi:MAG TPA: tRNA pseudouridine(38-40) synthase TruA [Hyphomicrobiaceae bacterium]|nr:tRNA pseudouridine(38-40) synthase TruA [Hyphomicrobiaceae bacterium]